MPRSDAYNILLADRYPIVRRGLKVLLEARPGFAICGEASNGLEAVEVARLLNPNLAVLDMTMPLIDGLETTREIRKVSPRTETLVVAWHFSQATVSAAILAGARGYVSRNEVDTDLFAAIDHVRQHVGFYVSRWFEASLTKATADSAAGKERASPPVDPPLTPRQLAVIELLAKGNKNGEVARELGISVRTSEAHRQRIMRKMHFCSLADLIKFAIRTGVVQS